LGAGDDAKAARTVARHRNLKQVKVLLDTQVVIEAYRPGGFATLPKKVQAILADPQNDRIASVASISK
jgi:hypothetical protein